MHQNAASCLVIETLDPDSLCNESYIQSTPGVSVTTGPIGLQEKDAGQCVPRLACPSVRE